MKRAAIACGLTGLIAGACVLLVVSLLREREQSVEPTAGGAGEQASPLAAPADAALAAAQPESPVLEAPAAPLTIAQLLRAGRVADAVEGFRKRLAGAASGEPSS